MLINLINHARASRLASRLQSLANPPPLSSPFPHGFTTPQACYLGCCISSVVLALESTGVFSEDFLVGNTQVASRLREGVLGKLTNSFFEPMTSTATANGKAPIRICLPLIQAARKCLKLRPGYEAGSHTFMGDFMEALRCEEGDYTGGVLAKLFTTTTRQQTTCTGCQNTWEQETRMVRIDLKVTCEPRDKNPVDLHDLFHQWTRSLERRGVTCTECSQPGQTEDRYLVTKVADILCVGLNRQQTRKLPAAPPKTRTPVRLPKGGFDFSAFFHPNSHHPLGCHLFQLTAIICHQDEGERGTPSYTTSRYIT